MKIKNRTSIINLRNFQQQYNNNKTTKTTTSTTEEHKKKNRKLHINISIDKAIYISRTY